MPNSWTLLRLNAQNQNKYVEHVQENIPDVELYFPRYEKITRPHGMRQPIVVKRPVYPGYIFAKLDINGESVHMLISTPVRARYVKFGQNIPTIPDRVIWDLQRLEGLKVLVREVQVNPFQPGRKVRIHTPVYDIQAMIISLLHGKRALVDTTLGRMSVHLHQMTLL